MCHVCLHFCGKLRIFCIMHCRCCCCYCILCDWVTCHYTSYRMDIWSQWCRYVVPDVPISIDIQWSKNEPTMTMANHQCPRYVLISLIYKPFVCVHLLQHTSTPFYLMIEFPATMPTIWQCIMWVTCPCRPLNWWCSILYAILASSQWLCTQLCEIFGLYNIQHGKNQHPSTIYTATCTNRSLWWHHI